jgi:hypothetical protein
MTRKEWARYLAAFDKRRKRAQAKLDKQARAQARRENKQ